MNAFYVTLSIPLLLVLAGFNHAHGLTTFGKPTSNNQQPSIVKAKQCSVQTNCTLIKSTTCLKGVCLCGDNHPPVNAECSAVFQGPNHICIKNEDCVDNADCIPIKEVKISNDIAHLLQTAEVSICKCQEGYQDTGATCGGGIYLSTMTYLVVALAICELVY